jgi:large subunit ribosomal protein L25
MDATLDAKKRDGRGKNEARRLRVGGRIPAVVYGSRKEGQVPEGVPVAVDPKEVLRILHSESGANTLINLKLDGGESRVMVRDYQLDPVTHQLLHADFYQLAMDKAIAVSVPVVIKGEPQGVKQQGGLLDFVTREIQVQCLPTDIPEHIDIDVSELMLHQSIRVRDIASNPKWKAVTDGDTMLVHVVMPKAEEAAATTTAEGAAAAPAAAGAAGTEPEVIKKGKTDEKEEKEKK